jgi:transcriptional regulator with XRE-family HTH domain
MLTPPQLRAARALLDWSREMLAERSGTSAETVKNFETRGSDPKRSTMVKWRSALAQSGVDFLDETDLEGPGVRLRKQAGKKR